MPILSSLKASIIPRHPNARSQKFLHDGTNRRRSAACVAVIWTLALASIISFSTFMVSDSSAQSAKPEPDMPKINPPVVIAPQDKVRAEKTLSALKAANWREAALWTQRIRDPLLRKALLWYRLTLPKTGDNFVTITSFLDGNQNWPARVRLRQRASALLDAKIPPRTLVGWFAKNEPRSKDSWLLYLTALERVWDKNKATAVARTIWQTQKLSGDEERTLLKRYKAAITDDDNIARLIMLVANGRRRQAIRLARQTKLSADARKAAQLVIRISGQQKKSEQLIVQAMVNELPKSFDTQYALGLLVTRTMRRADMLEAATSAMNRWAQKAGMSRAWYVERTILTRALIEKGEPKAAYAVIAAHRQENKARAMEAEILAGWLQLRRLNNPKSALVHFRKAITVAGKRKNLIARAHYWAGRAAAAANDADQAKAWYREASRHSLTFFGQLAALEMGAKTLSLPSAPPPDSGRATRTALDKDPRVRAAYMFHMLGADKAKRLMLAGLTYALKTPAERLYLAQLAQSMGLTQIQVRAAWLAGLYGPTDPALAYPQITVDGKSGVPLPLVFAIIRQESEFNPTAGSGAGALGLMQLLPGTARDMARSLGIPFDKARLTRDPAYNVQLGRHFFDSLLNRYKGSIPLALAAYNAGPRRVTEWLGRFGDPRTFGTDFIDWLEQIPFGETRSYVRRVLANRKVYQSLGGKNTLAPAVGIDWTEPGYLPVQHGQ